MPNSYIGFEQVVVQAGLVGGPAALTVPGTAARAHVQASDNDVRYTMDAATNPTVALGMVLVVGNEPEWFERDDLLRIRFISGAGADGMMNIHYWGEQ